jgi:hypothetical protein
MFPGVYGFHWELGHLIFLGIFFAILLKIAGTFALSLLRSARRLRDGKADAQLWKVDFSDLPLEEKSCRHALTGELKGRICANAFDCRECDKHEGVAGGLDILDSSGDGTVAGLDIPGDRFYHRGHTWVKPEADGTVVIGLDSFASRLIGKPDAVELPEPGGRIEAHGTGCRIQSRRTRMRILAPIGGEVLATGGPDQEWYLRVRPDESLCQASHLLNAGEARFWLTREWERLQRFLSSPVTGPALADGGALIEDMTADLDEAQLDHVTSSFFLQP